MSSLQVTGKAQGPLADAAERFDRLAQVVKEQQRSETRSGQRVALSETFSASPEEAWAKKFMTQAIGPAPAGVPSPSFPGFPGFGPAGSPAMQSFQSQGAQGAKPVGNMLASASALRPGGDLRAAAGTRAETVRPARRQRSWLAWLLLGR